MAAILLSAISIGLSGPWNGAINRDTGHAKLRRPARLAHPHRPRAPGRGPSGLIQALSFGVFLAVWLGLGLHLTSPEMGFAADRRAGALASGLNILQRHGLVGWSTASASSARALASSRFSSPRSCCSPWPATG